MTTGVGITALLVVALLVGLLAGWWLSVARRTAHPPEVGEGAVALPPDGPTHLTSGLVGEQAPADDQSSPGLAQAADDRLRELDELLAQGLIDRDEYTATREAILGEL